MAIFRSVASEVVSLRLSVLLREERGEAGAGQFIQIQAEDRMRSLAERIGARAEVHRTLQALVYQVSGPVADLDLPGVDSERRNPAPVDSGLRVRTAPSPAPERPASGDSPGSPGGADSSGDGT